MRNFFSRKFLMAVAGQVIAALVLFFPDAAEPIQSVGSDITALILSLGTALGYIVAEASVDKASAGKSDTYLTLEDEYYDDFD